MTTHFNSPRTWLLMLALVALAAVAMPNRVHAQLPCTCPNVFFKVDPNIPCTVNVCTKDALGLHCLAIAPGGGLFPVPCTGPFVFYLQNCAGNYVPVTPAMPVNCICMAPGCCVDAFVVQDVNGCWVIKVQPSPCPVC